MEHSIAYPGHLSVSLAAMKREYLPVLMQHANNTSVTQGVMLRPPVTLEAQTEWYERIAKRSDSDHVFAVLLRDEADGVITHRYIGHMGLHHISFPSAYAHTGSFLLEQEAHGKGYGTEAKLLLLYHAFYIKGLRKVCSKVKAFNGNSWGHLLKCGYRPVGRKLRQHFHLGSYVDEVIFEVFREDFEPIWDAYNTGKELPKLTEAQRSIIEKG